MDSPSWFINVSRELVNTKPIRGKIKNINMSIAYAQGKFKQDKNIITDYMIDTAKRVPFWRLLKCEQIGLRYRAHCPFHNEKNPSFYIYPDTNRGYCHGCNKSVDTIQFIVETRNIKFNEAVKLLLSY